MELEHKRIKICTHKEDIYYIKLINNLNFNLKILMSLFNSVATKYLENYLKQHKWFNAFSKEKDTIKTKNLIAHINIAHSYIIVKKFKIR